MLPEADYRATMRAVDISDAAGNSMPGDAVFNFRMLRGDTDGNGVIDFNDYARVDFGFNNHLSGWGNGDFDRNGVVDFDDYALIDYAFNVQQNAARGKKTRR
jgi:hypothetical protein